MIRPKVSVPRPCVLPRAASRSAGLPAPHPSTTVPSHDRAGLERLCRYVNRLPLAYGRLQRLDAERLSFTLKTPWDDGTCRIVLSPTELIEKLAALVPPPRVHLIRYHGVLAPHAADRAQIVPGPQEQPQDAEKLAANGSVPSAPRCRRLSWAQLLSRVFSLEVTVCPRCGGQMRMIAALTHPDSIRTYLTGVGLPADAPAISPARPPPQQELVFAA